MNRPTLRVLLPCLLCLSGLARSAERPNIAVLFADDTQDARTLFWEHEGNRAIRDGDWKLVGSRNGPWELYDMADDRTELHDLAKAQPVRFADLKSQWDAWAEKVNVLSPEEFEAAKKAFQKKNRKR